MATERFTETRATGPEEQWMLEPARERIAELEVKVDQLETALQSRISIEQAKGILAERLAVTVDEAFEILRYAARSHRTKLHEVAARVIKERQTPAPIVVAMARAQRVRAAWMREIADVHREQFEELHRSWHEQVAKVQGRQW